MTKPLLVVFSHLRWDFVFQRPQHVMTRIAESRPVLFIEEPVWTDGEPRWELSRPAMDVTVCRPHTPLTSEGFNDEQVKLIGPMLDQLIDGHERYDFWFYSPMAFALSERFRPSVVIYDNMDDLSAFQFAPPQLLERERALLERADVVFTGGPSLHQAMSGRHHNVHRFTSSVDEAHFAAAASPLPEPAEQAEILWPRLGFFGVLDERLDIPLLEAAADARPDWQFVMVGPVVKIDPATLPRRANIHYVGGQSYARLPGFLSGWDAAMLPFARNDSTRRISPTKILEYMAARKPIVSTRIADVVGPYGTMVGLGDEPEEFIAACELALAETAEQRARRNAQYDEVLSRTSWDATVAAMEALIEEARGHDRANSHGSALVDPADVAAPIVVIGAGPTGLSAAYHLGEGSILLEANDTVGGWCRSIEEGGFTFDWAGHIMFSNDPYVHEMYQMLLGDNVHWQDREAWIYSHDVYTRYPFQGSLYGLPPDVIKECIVGAIESRYGTAGTTSAPRPESPQKAALRPAPLSSPSHSTSNGHRNGSSKANGTACLLTAPDPKDGTITDCCGDGIAESTLRVAAPAVSRPSEPKAPENFEEFIYRVWGAGIARHFAIPYNEKIWAVPLAEMETSWLGGRVPMPDLEEMIAGALAPKPRPMGPNARFGYPLRGGFQALMDGFLPLLEGELRLNTRVRSVSGIRRTVTLHDGTEVPYSRLISTMPLPALIRAMGDEAPEEVKQAAGALRHTSVRCVNLGVGREALTEKHWIYYPGETVFHRIFVQGNASPHCNPPGGFGLTCEITYGPLKPLPCDGEDLIQRCIDDCVKVGIIDKTDEILVANQVHMPFAYVVYDHARPRNVATIRDWLALHDIHLAGRYSEWEYYNSDHAFLAGRKVAEAVRPASLEGKSAMSPLREMKS